MPGICFGVPVLDCTHAIKPVLEGVAVRRGAALSSDHLDIDALLAEPRSPGAGRALLAWVDGLRGRILRGDAMIGILAPEEIAYAPAALRRAAECGIDSAYIELSKWLASPPYGEPDLLAAEEVLREPVKLDVAGALTQFVRVRYFYRRQEATPEEQREVYEMLAGAVNRDSPESEHLYFLGLCTSQGFGVDPDPTAAFALHQRAAALGNVDAMFELYAHYQNGLGVPRDEAAAFAANLAAAEAGSARAMYNMGTFCATGKHVPKNATEAASWYKRASDAGHLRAMATLAVMAATGEGVEQDRDYARRLFDEADYLGYDTSQFRRMAGL